MYEFKTIPRIYQVQALKKIAYNDGRAALLMDPGTGKTKVVIDYLGALFLKYGPQDWLVTAPLSALDGWPIEIDRHLSDEVPREIIDLTAGRLSIEEKAQHLRDLEPNPGVLRIVLLNHDAFGSKAKARALDGSGRKLSTVTVWDRIVGAVESWSPHGIVLDESHRMKGHTSYRSQAMARLAKSVPRRLALTGTVAPRNVLDIYGQWLFVNPSRFGTDWNAFRFYYAKWGGYENKQPVAFLNTAEMRKKVLEDAVVVKKEDALDLPPVTEVVVPIRLDERERKAYRDMGSEMLVELDSGEEAIAPIPLTRMLRLRQITGGFIGYTDEYGESRETRLGDSKVRTCVEKTLDLLDAGEKVVIFAHFREDLSALEARLRSRLRNDAVPVHRVDGSTSKADRLAARAQFLEDARPQVFIAQMRTMSLGVNELVASRVAIFFSLSERRDDYDQCRDRLDRLGQTRPMTIYHLAVPDSVDEVILQGHRDKLNLERAITTRQQAERILTLGGSE